MQEVKYQIVKKQAKDLSPNDKVLINGDSVCRVLDKTVFFERQITEINFFRAPDCSDISMKKHNDFLFDVIKDVAESATTEEPEQPAPETATTEIKGERFTVTRKPCGGWSEPVPWVPAVGDEVRLSELKQGDSVLIPGVVHDRVGEVGKIGVRLPQGNDCVKWFRPSDQVIYNGRAE